MTRATRARIFTTAGVIHLTLATLLALTFLFGPSAPATGAAMGFTPTPTQPTEETPSVTSTPKRTTPEPRPRLTITKSVSPTEVFPGDVVTIKIKVCNDGDAVARDVVVSDNVPSQLEVLSASASMGRAVIVGNGVRGEFGDMLPGVCATLTISARVRDDVAPGTRISNVATIGDLVSNEVSLTAQGLLPESGEAATRIVVAALLVVGAGLLAVGLAMAPGRWLGRRRAVRETVEDC